MENCAICQLHLDPTAQERYEIQRSELWVLRYHPDPAPYQVGFSWIHEGTVPAPWISRRPRLLIGGALFAMPLPLVREPSTFISISSQAI